MNLFREADHSFQLRPLLELILVLSSLCYRTINIATYEDIDPSSPVMTDTQLLVIKSLLCNLPSGEFSFSECGRQ